MKIAIIALFLLLVPEKCLAEVDLNGATGQLALAMTILKEAGGEIEEGQVAAIKVVLARAELSGETVIQVLSMPRQFVGYGVGVKASEVQQLLKMLDLVWRVYRGDYGTYGNYTNFYAVGSKTPSWAVGRKKVRIGNHYFLVLPYSVGTIEGKITMIRNMGKICPDIVYCKGRKSNNSIARN